ncbi:MAG: hypothetical protein ACK526_07470 [Planctomyces sp.]
MSDKHYVHPHDENDLEKVLKQTGTWFERYGTTAIYGVAALLALTAVIVYVSKTPPATAPASAAFMSAEGPEQFRDIADQFPNTALGVKARLRQADLLRNSAIEKLFTNRKLALDEIDQAQKAYERLEQQKGIDAEVRLRTLVGLAHLAEYTCDGSDAKTTAALNAWKRVTEEFPGEQAVGFQKLAEDRIKALQLDSSKSFYAWFQQQDPKPSDEPLIPQDNPSNVPAIPQSFNLPDFSNLPGADAAAKPAEAPAEGAPAASAPAAETPAADAPKAETPAAAEPAAAEPAAEGAATGADAPKADAPATDAPATDAPATDAPATDAPADPPTTGEASGETK